MKTETLYKKPFCSACGACKAICPKDAIVFIQDKSGVDYPFIQTEKCIDCGQCISVCHYSHGQIHKDNSNEINKTTYAACGSTSDIKNSASGGIFYSLAKKVINANGLVAGAVLEREKNGFHLKHVLTSDISTLEKMRGSKYIQSETSECFLEIRKFLRMGKLVLFGGTPCQVKALKCFLRAEYKNLFCIDLICHGVPPLELFNTYIRTIENKNNVYISEFKFRDKQSGDGLFGSFTFKDKNGNVFTHRFPARESSYYGEFLDGSIYRDNCYLCPYASSERPGDLSIGDYWNLDLADPNAFKRISSITDFGVSVISVQNEQGKVMIELFGSDLIMVPSSYKKAAAFNKQMIQPSEYKKSKREAMLNNFSAFSTVYHIKYNANNIKINILRMIPQSLKYIIKKILKKR